MAQGLLSGPPRLNTHAQTRASTYATQLPLPNTLPQRGPSTTRHTPPPPPLLHTQPTTRHTCIPSGPLGLTLPPSPHVATLSLKTIIAPRRCAHTSPTRVRPDCVEHAVLRPSAPQREPISPERMLSAHSTSSLVDLLICACACACVRVRVHVRACVRVCVRECECTCQERPALESVCSCICVACTLLCM
jgi:hypothetical protein